MIAGKCRFVTLHGKKMQAGFIALHLGKSADKFYCGAL